VDPPCPYCRDRHRVEVPDRVPPGMAVGAHLVTQRRGYLHHGIYVGENYVVHYAGLAHGLRRRPVEEVPLVCFARGEPVWVRLHARPPDFSGHEIAARARSRVGEDRYRLFTNNCEHFCEWCWHDEPRSYQVSALAARTRRACRSLIRRLGISSVVMGRRVDPRCDVSASRVPANHPATLTRPLR